MHWSHSLLNNRFKPQEMSLSELNGIVFSQPRVGVLRKYRVACSSVRRHCDMRSSPDQLHYVPLPVIENVRTPEGIAGTPTSVPQILQDFNSILLIRKITTVHRFFNNELDEIIGKIVRSYDFGMLRHIYTREYT